jgi:hypothetical protein
MALDPTRTLQQVLDDANPTSLATALQQIGFGAVLRSLPVMVHAQVPETAPTDALATTHIVRLPDACKAQSLHRAYARVGTVSGELTCDAGRQTTTIVTAHAAVTESGDIALLSTDAITSIDLEYVPAKQDIVEVTLPVVAASGVCALPAWITTRGVKTIVGATIVTATNTGTCKVITPAAAVPTSTLNVNLNVAKTQVQFRIADAVTLATIKLALVPAIDTNAVLAAASSVV